MRTTLGLHLQVSCVCGPIQHVCAPARLPGVLPGGLRGLLLCCPHTPTKHAHAHPNTTHAPQRTHARTPTRTHTHPDTDARTHPNTRTHNALAPAATYTGKYYSAGRYAGKACRYSRVLGTDVTLRLGGGSTATTLRSSARQLDIVPVLNQFFFRVRRGGWELACMC